MSKDRGEHTPSPDESARVVAETYLSRKKKKRSGWTQKFEKRRDGTIAPQGNIRKGQPNKNSW